MKKQLAIGIISLFILTAVSPLAFGFNIQISNEIEPQSASSGGLMDSAWPMFQQNVRHTGRSPYGPNDGNTPVVKWKFLLKRGVKSSPAIDNDGTIYIGAEDSPQSFFAINPNGTEKWRFDAGDWVDSSPAIDENGNIYFGTLSGKFFALNPNGTEKWRFDAGDWVFSSPVIDIDGTIYVGNTDGIFYAVNPNGEEKWRFNTGRGMWSSPALDNDTIYFGCHNYYLYALHINGTMKWKYKTNAEVKSSPTIGDDGTIYVCSWDYYLYAINPDGTLKWKFNTGTATETSPSITLDGSIYIANYNGRIFCINPNGTEKWHYDTGDTVYSSPAIDKNGIIYIGSTDDFLYALNPDGTLKWKFRACDDGIQSSSAIAEDGTIYIAAYFKPTSERSAYAYLYALDVIENEPPNTPNRPSGETNGKVGDEYTYTTSTTDPDGDACYYWFDWGDGSNSGWVGPFNSGDISNASHTWTSQGSYDIKVKAKDIYEAQSGYSDTLTVSITKKSKSMTTSFFLNLFERFPLLTLFLQILY